MVSLFGFGFPGHTELLIIGAIVLLLFGNRLPGVMRSLGQGITEFKKGIQGVEEEIDDAANSGASPTLCKQGAVPDRRGGLTRVTVTIRRL